MSIGKAVSTTGKKGTYLSWSLYFLKASVDHALIWWLEKWSYISSIWWIKPLLLIWRVLSFVVSWVTTILFAFRIILYIFLGVTMYANYTGTLDDLYNIIIPLKDVFVNAYALFLDRIDTHFRNGIKLLNDYVDKDKHITSVPTIEKESLYKELNNFDDDDSNNEKHFWERKMFWIATGLSIVTILVYIYRVDIGGGLGGAASELWKTISNKSRYSSIPTDQISDSDVSPIQLHPPISANNTNSSVVEPLSPGLVAEADASKLVEKAWNSKDRVTESTSGASTPDVPTPRASTPDVPTPKASSSLTPRASTPDVPTPKASYRDVTLGESSSTNVSRSGHK